MSGHHTIDARADGPVHRYQELLSALNNLDGAMCEIMLGLLMDTLSADELVRFGCKDPRSMGADSKP
jgi:hypothetical protein